MQPALTTTKTFRNQQETITYLEGALAATLHQAAQNIGPNAILMDSIDATTRARRAAGGNAERVSADTIAFLKASGNHHVGVGITAGCYHLRIKLSPVACRMTMALDPAVRVPEE